MDQSYQEVRFIHFPDVLVIELDDGGFKLQRLETDEDVQRNLTLMRIVFGERTGVDKLVQKLIDHHPSMTLHDFLVIKHDGKVVASIALVPVKWSVGGVQKSGAR